MMRRTPLICAIAAVFLFDSCICINCFQMQNYGPCVTIDGIWGLCINMMQCTKMAEMTCRKSATLVNTVCGPHNVRGLVCCSHNDINILDDTSQNASPYLQQAGTCGKVFSIPPHYGNASLLYDHPWMATIMYQRNDNSIVRACAGSLINSRYVLTTGYCLDMPDLTPYAVRLGDWDFNKNPDCLNDINGKEHCADPSVVLPIEKHIIHPNYNMSTFDNNVGLIRLTQSVTYTDFIRPICLPVSESFKRASFEYCVMHSSSVVSSDGKIFKSYRNVLPQDRCNAMTKKTYNHICTQSFTKVSSCDATTQVIGRETTDMKGVTYFMAGVISSIVRVKGSPEVCVFARINESIDWIQQNLKP